MAVNITDIPDSIGSITLEAKEFDDEVDSPDFRVAFYSRMGNPLMTATFFKNGSKHAVLTVITGIVNALEHVAK